MEVETIRATTASESAESSPIVLPLGYQLSNWRVSDGSVVHVGETVAVISPIDATTSESTRSTGTNTTVDNDINVDQIISTNHKRPSRRKRPLPVSSELVSPDAVKDTLTNSSTGSDTGTNVPQSSSVTAAKPSHTVDSSVMKSTENNSKISNVHAIHHSRDCVGGKTIIARADGICRKIDSPPTVATQTDVIVGWIDPCRHPTMISGLCAVCGTKVTSDVPDPDQGSFSPSSVSSTTADDNNNNVSQNMTLMTVSGMTVKVSDSESKRMALADTKRLEGIKKLSLVLDLDHTLLHATADPRAERQCGNRRDIRRLVLPLMMADNTNSTMYPQIQYHPGWLQQHFVKLRPHVKEFVEQAMEHYELGVYTAGTRDYAEQVTILLSRHLVGAERDQIELEQLQQRLVQVEQAYHQQQITGRNSDSNNKETEPESDALAVSVPADAAMQENNNGGKRKRVQFEIPPPSSAKTNEISLEELENLRSEMRMADSLERQAHDLRRRLFGSRVMSRTESGESARHVKSLKRIFPCGGSMAAVIDDREDVWANAEEMSSRRPGEPPENLLLVRPYHWSLFQGYADVNNASGMDFLQVDTSSQAESDEQLVWTSNVLKSLHQRYYDREGSTQRTVPMILEEMRSVVLKGCIIVLSGLVPLSKQQSVDQNQPRPPFVRYAESLGAVVQSHVSAAVTHVVAANDGTDKILSARKVKGCKIVKPSWLIECYWSMTRRDENLHLLGSALKQTSLETNVMTSQSVRVPILNDIHKDLVTSAQDQNYDDDDDDDDFAAELENEFLNVDEDDDEEM